MENPSDTPDVSTEIKHVSRDDAGDIGTTGDMCKTVPAPGIEETTAAAVQEDATVPQPVVNAEGSDSMDSGTLHIVLPNEENESSGTKKRKRKNGAATPSSGVASDSMPFQPAGDSTVLLAESLTQAVRSVISLPKSASPSPEVQVDDRTHSAATALNTLPASDGSTELVTPKPASQVSDVASKTDSLSEPLNNDGNAATGENNLATPPPKKLAKHSLDGSSSSSEKQPKKRQSTPNGAAGIIDAKWLEPFKYGWNRELVFRATKDPNKSTAMSDVYYHSPDKIKLRSLREIEDFLKQTKDRNVTIQNFTWTKRAIFHNPQEIVRQAGSTGRGCKANKGAVTQVVIPTPKKVIPSKATSQHVPKRNAKRKLSNPVSPACEETPLPKVSRKFPEDYKVMKSPDDPLRLKLKKNCGTKAVKQVHKPVRTPQSSEQTAFECSAVCAGQRGAVPDLMCRGCWRMYHPACVGVSNSSRTFTCVKCRLKNPDAKDKSSISVQIRAETFVDLDGNFAHYDAVTCTKSLLPDRWKPKALPPMKRLPLDRVRKIPPGIEHPFDIFSRLLSHLNPAAAPATVEKNTVVSDETAAPSSSPLLSTPCASVPPATFQIATDKNIVPGDKTTAASLSPLPSSSSPLPSSSSPLPSSSPPLPSSSSATAPEIPPTAPNSVAPADKTAAVGATELEAAPNVTAITSQPVNSSPPAALIETEARLTKIVNIKIIDARTMTQPTKGVGLTMFVVKTGTVTTEIVVPQIKCPPGSRLPLRPKYLVLNAEEKPGMLVMGIGNYLTRLRISNLSPSSGGIDSKKVLKHGEAGGIGGPNYVTETDPKSQPPTKQASGVQKPLTESAAADATTSTKGVDTGKPSDAGSETTAVKEQTAGIKVAKRLPLSPEHELWPIQILRYNTVSLFKVFEYLRQDDLARVACVNSFWRWLASHTNLWRAIRLDGIQVTNWEALVKVMKKYGSVMLDMRGMTTFEDKNRTWHEFMSVLSDLGGIQRIDFGLVPVSILHTVVSRLLQLEVLTAEHCTDMSYNETAASTCRLDLSKFSQLTELKKLRLRGVGGMSLRLSSLGSLSKLHHLSLTSLKDVPLSDFEFLKSLDQLTTLELGDCTSWEHEHFKFFESLSRLTRLRLEHGKADASRSLGDTLTGLQNLQHVELYRFHLDEPLLKAVSKLPQLRRLSLWPNTDQECARVNTAVYANAMVPQLQRFVWGVMAVDEQPEEDDDDEVIVLDSDSSDEETNYKPKRAKSGWTREQCIPLQLANKMIGGVSSTFEYLSWEELRERATHRIPETLVELHLSSEDDSLTISLSRISVKS